MEIKDVRNASVLGSQRISESLLEAAQFFADRDEKRAFSPLVSKATIARVYRILRVKTSLPVGGGHVPGEWVPYPRNWSEAEVPKVFGVGYRAFLYAVRALVNVGLVVEVRKDDSKPRSPRFLYAVPDNQAGPRYGDVWK